jgi:hypothetical protein
MAKLLVKQVEVKINCPLTQEDWKLLGLRKWDVEHDSNPLQIPWDDKQVKHLVSAWRN